MQRFLNALLGWELTDLNQDRANYPAADLGDKSRRIAVQVTNREDAEKIKDTHAKALDPKHTLAREFDTLYVLFFIPTRKPSPPKNLLQPDDRPRDRNLGLERSPGPDAPRRPRASPRGAGGSRKRTDPSPFRRLPSQSPLAHETPPHRRLPRRPGSRVGPAAPGLGHPGDQSHRHPRQGWRGQDRARGRLDGRAGRQGLARRERVLDWSFYSQGTRDQSSATSEVFVHDALEHLGDPDPNAGDAEARAGRLARLLGGQRCLLVLDGLEPLQYPPGPMHGALKDPGMAALLRGLVARNAGLCVVTTRERVDEIQQHYGKSAVDHELKFLTRWPARNSCTTPAPAAPGSRSVARR
jgi:hypothetical protein